MSRNAQTDRTRWLLASDSELLGQCQVNYLRGSGSGGQKRNKTSNAVQLSHESGVQVRCEESRSRESNREQALRLLRFAIAQEIRGNPDIDIVREWIGQRASKREKGSAAYCQAVAHLLDLMVKTDYSFARCGVEVGVNTAAIVRFIKNDKRLVRVVNERRTVTGLSSIQ